MTLLNYQQFYLKFSKKELKEYINIHFANKSREEKNNIFDCNIDKIDIIRNKLENRISEIKKRKEFVVFQKAMTMH